jgi:uncharacterized membrane protein
VNIPAYLWHPIFVHFSVALLSVATIFYVLAAVFRKAQMRARWVHFARWNLWGGTGLSVLTALLGWLAYSTVGHDDPSHEAMDTHATLALVTLAAFGVLALWVAPRRWANEPPSFIFTFGLLAAFALLVATGLRGGQLVFHYGLAVDSLPRPEAGIADRPTAAGPVGPDAAQKVPGPTPHRHKHKHDARPVE